MENRLKKIIVNNFTKENGRFFYSFDLTPKDDLNIDIKELKYKPLFVDITWISDDNLKMPFRECPAYLLAKKLRKKVHVVNNITCYRLEDQNIGEILAKKLQNFTLLRGDQIEYGQKYSYASELIREFRRVTYETVEDITIFVAGYPQKHPDSKNLEVDLEYLRKKMVHGANAILTQVTFSSDEFCNFVRNCRDVGISDTFSIIPGLYIPSSYAELNRVCNITKVSLPSKLRDEFELLQNDVEKFRKHSLSFTKDLIRNIQRDCPEHIRGFHFYTMNDLTMLKRLMDVVKFSEA